MLFLIYLGQEIRHRLRQTVLIGAGLAVGVALVITVNAVATGAADAEAGVLHGLYGLGTDMTVTRPYNHHDTDPGKENHEINAGGPPVEYLDVANQGLFAESVAASVAALAGVREAAGVLALGETTNAGPSLPTTIPVDGVDPAHPRLGPLSQAHVVSGRALSTSDAGAQVALVDSRYAAAHHLSVGSVISLAWHRFRVVGIMEQAPGTHPDILIPLHTAQSVSGLDDEISSVYISVDRTSDLGTVETRIKTEHSWADVTTSASLSKELGGSLSQTSWLAEVLGRWLTIAVLIAAFALAALVTVGSVSRQVREFGTLKALGWSTGRITAQVIGESAAIGIVGAVTGVALGCAATALVSRLASTLTATAAAAPGHSEPKGFIAGGSARTGEHFFHQIPFFGTYDTLPVHFAAPVAISVVVLAAGLGIAGGLFAGALAAWRAARLRPAVALARVG
jgi:putative ABC transport system permease protein